MLLALDVDVLFFLLVAAIGLLNQFFQKTKKIRAESLRQKKRRESRDRVDTAKELEATREDRPVSMRRVTEDLRERAEAATSALDDGAGREAIEAPATRLEEIRISERMRVAARSRRHLPPPPSAQKQTTKRVEESMSAKAVASRLRNNPTALREAIILREILGPPAAHRGPHSQRTR